MNEQTIKYKISYKDPLFKHWLNEYKRTRDFDNSLIRQHLNQEISISSDYSGREIYELIQNAEDENSETVSIELNTERRELIVSNDGQFCKSFSPKGFKSIMMSGMSPKEIEEGSFIGCKGLGFRSLINWAEEIKIISSNVCCIFSKDISQKYWNEIKHYLLETLDKSDAENLIKKHESYAAEKKYRKSPVPILSIPEVTPSESNGFTTQIRVLYKKQSEQSIIEQIQSLSSYVLLFLQNIKKIKVTINNEERIIFKGSVKNTDDNLQKIIISDNSLNAHEWLIYRKRGFLPVNIEDDITVNKKYEISIAYDKENHSSGNVVYAFFPTKVQLHLPCVLHATFELNSSRNNINSSDVNNKIQEFIADALIEFAELLARNDNASNTTWHYLEMLLIDNENEKNEFPIINDRLLEKRKLAKVFPTIADGYRCLSETSHYSEKWAEYLHGMDICSLGIMKSHLIPKFTEHSIDSQEINDRSFYDMVRKLSEDLKLNTDTDERLKMRSKLIAAVSSVVNSFYEDGKILYLPVLEDENGNLIYNEANINVGESINYLPNEIKVCYVSDKLINLLITEFELQSNRRYVTDRLSKNRTANVSDMDVTNLKRKIIAFLKKCAEPEFNKESFVQLMYAFYNYNRENILNKRNNTNLNSLFKESEFCLLSGNNNMCAPSLLIFNDEIKVSRKWKIYGTEEEWTNWFTKLSGKEEDTSDIVNFFIDYIGVSRQFAMQKVCIEYKDEYYLNTYVPSGQRIDWYSFSTSKLQDFRHTDEQANNYYIPNIDYLRDYVSNMGCSLCELIRQMEEDPKIMHELNRKSIYYQYRTFQTDFATLSYPAYRLRQYDIFEDVSSYVISERCSLLANIELEKELNKLVETNEGSNMVFLLGAKQSLSDLSIDSLYDILLMLPDRNLKNGIQRIYKSVREAINTVCNKDVTRLLNSEKRKKFLEEGNVYARKNGGPVQIVKASETYYWDNDQLPTNILKEKFKLEIGNRVGEDNVKEIFGVKLAKEINIEILNYKENKTLSDEFYAYFNKRIIYMMAYRIHNNNRDINDEKRLKDYANALKNIHILFYTECDYTNDSAICKLNDGEMVTTKEGGKTVFHVCCSCCNISLALRIPSFCENITEIICIILKITSNETANSFRSILKNTEEENKYISNKEISDDEFDIVKKAVGLSKQESDFWLNIGRLFSVEINIAMLATNNREKRKYITTLFPDIVLPDDLKEVSEMNCIEKYEMINSLKIKDAGVLGKKGLYDYYNKWIEDECSIYKIRFTNFAYRKILDDIQIDNLIRAGKFHDKVIEFIEHNWIVSIDNMHFYDGEELRRLFDADLHEHFGITLSELEDNESLEGPIIRKEYMEVIQKYGITEANLSTDELALTYFEGNVETFEQGIKSKLNITEGQDYEQEDSDNGILPIIYCEGSNKITNDNNKGSRSGGKKIPKKGHVPDIGKQKAGQNAEEKVLHSLQNDKEHFTDVTQVSRNSKQICGDDSLHYDIIYRRIVDGVPEKHTRYLEVKSMNDDTFYMSSGEYDFAKGNELYDLALVCNDEIKILQQPFAKNDGTQLIPVPDNYKVILYTNKI